ncbi:cyclopropane-fatty-acyl-phospholipid synthase family protein [Lentzea sp. BCCO 10_0061]|uniref:Cyclopropane-fatty-acyl-phospholipid synthase family protein n=1 Tax=Lentzea sokolovensis TaxID=3095429 RepID=A0ABU4URZ4_9PSEU|nr:cyclopropane-fatty-acyl-phospholipid synthase family protein [Lentzea sp. BCCO 10_0061]MDX8141573.1 cyclopropane-fatty-acyl-phospholipid synthase family protein [Lentzea sp. BCCO 10_0061]
MVIRSPRAVRHVLRSPGELGLARAFVTGDLDVDGDLKEGLRSCREMVRTARRPGFSELPRIVSLLVRLGGIGCRPRVPKEEARLSGGIHSGARDRAAVAHHYDLGNDFYEKVLDPSMSYSCAQWEPGNTDDLARAQRDKLDMVCRKLGLAEGKRLLDVGCGWGALVLHAAEHYQAVATGVTLSARQAEYVRTLARERGLSQRVTVHELDYRDIVMSGFDAVASIEMGEHVGDENYWRYCEVLAKAVRPNGLVYLQQMSRGEVAPSGGAFIESYIAPDMTMRPLDRTLAHLERSGLEVREVVSAREHYVRTIDAWARRLEDNWDEVLHRYGSRRGRIWRLYLAGSALAFEESRMSVHRIVARRTS